MKYSILLLLFFAFSFLFRTDSSFDQDLGRHIRLGEIIVKSRQVPTTNLFSYTNPDFPFINTHWLFEVFVYFWSITLELQSLLVLKIIIFLSSVWLIFKIIPKENKVLLLPIGFIFLHVLRERLELRPEIFSFLFTAGTYFILEKFTSSLRANKVRAAISQNNQIASSPAAKLIFLLPIIQLVWINTHIYFFVGLILQVIFLIYMGYQHIRSKVRPWKLKLLLIIFLLSVSISAINPNGLSGILYPLNVTKNYGYTIVENQTMFLLESIQFRDPNFLFVKISIGIILLSIFFVILNAVKNLLRMQVSNELRDPSLFTQDDRLKNILLALTGLGLALLNVRSFPYLVFLSLPATLMNLPAFRFKAITFILSLVTCALLLLESFFYLNGSYYRYTDSQHQVGLKMVQSVRGAMDFVLAKDLPQPIFNNFDIGSYILYRGYPKLKVFVDGRPEAYPAQFFTGVYIPSQYDYKNFKELEKIYNFKSIIFSHTDQTPWGKAFLQNVVKDQEWKLVYIDDFMVVLVKQGSILAPIDLSKLNPNSYQFSSHLSYLRLGLFLLSTQNIASGRQFVTKSLEFFPDDPIGNQLKGQPSKNIFFW